jgi:hypothetical protein
MQIARLWPSTGKFPTRRAADHKADLAASPSGGRLRSVMRPESAGARAGSAGSGGLGEHLVQHPDELLRQGHESAMVTGEFDYGSTEPVGECQGTTVGELPL